MAGALCVWPLTVLHRLLGDSEIIPWSDLLGATAAATTTAPDFYWVYMFQNMIDRWLGVGCMNVF